MLSSKADLNFNNYKINQYDIFTKRKFDGKGSKNNAIKDAFERGIHENFLGYTINQNTFYKKHYLTIIKPYHESMFLIQPTLSPSLSSVGSSGTSSDCTFQKLQGYL